ncbi:hypothetical protein [Mesorhizobium qingshengii]|uniref:hypothetical protein n=1 Tax=Mesorhizobium qingshengii TaxID=1165689 RepID=UPI00115F857D|nr:hypothetical protein [Mesorhizobium qingshengii]
MLFLFKGIGRSNAVAIDVWAWLPVNAQRMLCVAPQTFFNECHRHQQMRERQRSESDQDELAFTNMRCFSEIVPSGWAFVMGKPPCTDSAALPSNWQHSYLQVLLAFKAAVSSIRE